MSLKVIWTRSPKLTDVKELKRFQLKKKKKRKPKIGLTKIKRELKDNQIKRRLKNKVASTGISWIHN